ncbi:MAG: hypothetical protein JSR33_08460, partial [Proteobacteria bacterium]|nr:hypothetical protein [Pseudomonadota bacterium]
MVTIILHTLGLWALINIFHYSLDGWQLLLILISGGSGKEFTAAVASVTAHHLFLISSYLLIIYAVAYLCGKALRFLINRFQLDKFSVFEIDSPWYYLFKSYDWQDGKPSGVRIAATLEMGGKCFLYVGILETFFLTAEGNIDRLVLTNAMRRKITKDKDSK